MGYCTYRGNYSYCKIGQSSVILNTDVFWTQGQMFCPRVYATNTAIDRSRPGHIVQPCQTHVASHASQPSHRYIGARKKGSGSEEDHGTDLYKYRIHSSNSWCMPVNSNHSLADQPRSALSSVSLGLTVAYALCHILPSVPCRDCLSASFCSTLNSPPSHSSLWK